MNIGKRKGIALVEVVVALILLTGYIVFNTALYYDAFRNVRDVQQNTIATNLLIKTAEQVKAQSYDEVIDWLDTHTTSSYTFNIAVEVTIEEYNALEYKTAKVTISWNESDSMCVNILKYNPPVWIPVT